MTDGVMGLALGLLRDKKAKSFKGQHTICQLLYWGRGAGRGGEELASSLELILDQEVYNSQDVTVI